MNTRERYIELIDLCKSGFFNDVRDFDKQFVKKNGQVDLDRLYQLWERFSFGRYTLKYYLIHKELMPTFGGISRYVTRPEALYRECIEKNITWKEVPEYQEPPDDALF